MIQNPAKVPQKEISSVDVPNQGAGLFLGGAQNGPNNAFISSKDLELTREGFLTPRRKLLPFLPPTIETTYQIFPALWNGKIYYFTADANKIRWCLEGDTGWTICTGDNTITTNAGGMPTFGRVLNNILMANGTNGDKLCYVDLSTSGFPVVKYSPVADPISPLSSSLTNLTTGPFQVYYAFTYSSAVGETALSPILTQSINITRDQWRNNVSTPSSVTLTRTGPNPANSQKWNLYAAVASTSGSIQSSDMLQIATGLDLNTFTFTDDGQLSFNLSNVAPDENATDGPRVDHIEVEDGNPILYGDVDAPYNIWIGGGGPNAMSFSTANNGYLAQPEQGTNYYPTSIVGFRTGQGTPALTVLYSNTEGLSKQAVLQQQTVNYGEQSFTVWGVTEQHYGAAGVASPYSAVNYNGQLLFFSYDGFMSASTQPSVQNVLSILPISLPIDDLVRGIRNEAAGKVVGTGWNNKFMYLVPSNGFDSPQQILVIDTNNKGVEGKGAFYTLDIPAQWIGVISPQTTAAFVYVQQGNRSYKLLAGGGTFDTKNGINVPFSVSATGTLIGMGGSANVHNSWQADVQTMFTVNGLVGDITVGVNYRNQSGRLKTKRKLYHGPSYNPTTAGGWGDPQWIYAKAPMLAGWGKVPLIDTSKAIIVSSDVRIPVQVDDIMNEAQWFIEMEAGYNDFSALRGISYEGVALGVRPDLQ